MNKFQKGAIFFDEDGNLILPDKGGIRSYMGARAEKYMLDNAYSMRYSKDYYDQFVKLLIQNGYACPIPWSSIIQ
jgi:hypothetical protein